MDKASNSPRKDPKQGRSKALVESIFEATVRVLPKVGSYHVTTKKIAEVAGVSIGSLYQYFPNKAALLGALMDVVLERKVKEFEEKIAAVENDSMNAVTEAMVEFTLIQFLSERDKVREIFFQAPELGRLPAILACRQSIVERLSVVMEKHQPGFSREEYLRVSFIAVNSVMGIVLTMLHDDRQTYSVRELTQELNLMLNAYFAEKRRVQ